MQLYTFQNAQIANGATMWWQSRLLNMLKNFEWLWVIYIGNRKIVPILLVKLLEKIKLCVVPTWSPFSRDSIATFDAVAQ